MHILKISSSSNVTHVLNNLRNVIVLLIGCFFFFPSPVEHWYSGKCGSTICWLWAFGGV